MKKFLKFSFFALLVPFVVGYSSPEIFKALGHNYADLLNKNDVVKNYLFNSNETVEFQPRVDETAIHSAQVFMKEYCIDCHGPKKQKGQVRLDTIDWNITDNDSAQRFQDILDQLHSGDMPPWDEDQPTEPEMNKMLDTLTLHIDDARIKLANHKGEIKMRRLNRREYNNSLQALLGFKADLELIPEDIESENFDTVGQDQFFTSNDFEDYLEAGKSASLQALNWIPKKLAEPTVQRIDRADKVYKKYKKIVAKGDKQMAMKKAGKDWKEMGFKDAGDAKILFNQFWARIDKPRRYTELPRSKEGVYLTNLGNGFDAHATIHIDPRADYKFRTHGGYEGDPIEQRKIFNIFHHHSSILGSFKFNQPASDPETIEVTIPPRPGKHNRHGLTLRNNYQGLSRQFDRQVAIGEKPLLGKEPWASIWIDWMEFEGPFYPDQSSVLETIFFPNGRTDNAKATMMWDEHAKALIEKFAYEAFRRKQPEPEYVDKIHQYYVDTRKAGSKYQDAMAEAFSLILSSPQFLYIVEPSKVLTGNRKLDNRELAIRLSYFLWSAPPDEALYAANLRNPESYSAQVDRMLDDPRSEAFRDGFISQWADLHRFDAITIDNRLYKNYSAGLRFSAKQEVKEFFGHLIKENLPAHNFIDSDFITVDQTLAIHYGLDQIESINETFSKVKLPQGSPRGGLTTQAAFLMLGSNGERSSPVIRGAFLQEKLLNDKPLPPPPNVPELGTSTDKPLTNRELVKLHQQQKVCSSCHHKMDAIGFGLENFDAIGAWRDTEKVKKKQVPINPASALPGGAKFENIHELKSLLLKEKELLARQLTESMLSYALGRTVQFSDQTEVDSIMEDLTRDDYPIASMIKAVAHSKLFKRK